MRDGKGGKDRVTVLPTSLVEPLERQLERARSLHELDLREGFVYTHVLNKGGEASGARLMKNEGMTTGRPGAIPVLFSLKSFNFDDSSILP